MKNLPSPVTTVTARTPRRVPRQRRRQLCTVIPHGPERGPARFGGEKCSENYLQKRLQ